MADVVALLKQDQGDKAPEVFANEMGIRYTSLYHYYRGSKELGLDNARKIAKYYAEKGEMDKVLLIASYLVDFDLALPE